MTNMDLTSEANRPAQNSIFVTNNIFAVAVIHTVPQVPIIYGTASKQPPDLVHTA